MIVSYTQSDKRYDDRSGYRVVLGIYKYRKSDVHDQYLIFNDPEQTIPTLVDTTDCKVIDDTIPTDWEEITIQNGKMITYPAALKDNKYFTYIVHDNLYPAESKQAYEQLYDEYYSIVDDYIKRTVGSRKNLQELFINNTQNEQKLMEQERGYEVVDTDQLEKKLVDFASLSDIVNAIENRPSER